MLQERIMLTGESSTGKTSAVLTIAKHLPTHVFHVIDTDSSYERMLAGSRFKGVKNINLYPSRTWDSCEKALDVIRTHGKRLDQWVVVDFLCSTWDFVQGHFIREVFGKKMDEYFLEARKALQVNNAKASKLEVMRGWVDWPVINKIYQDWIDEICYQLPMHVIVTTKADTVQRTDDSEILDLWGSYGVKPAGEKRNTYRMQTLILMQRDKTPQWYMTTVKDRERDWMKKQVLVDFYLQYLVGIAGWDYA